MIGEWRSLVAHLLWEQRVAGSNPVSPTILPSMSSLIDLSRLPNAAVSRW
jgi:hypothetical protein